MTRREDQRLTMEYFIHGFIEKGTKTPKEIARAARRLTKNVWAAFPEKRTKRVVGFPEQRVCHTKRSIR